MYRLKNHITIDPDIVSGTPVFKGTRVPIEALFLYLREGLWDEFFENFPSVSRKQAKVVIGLAGEMISSKNVAQLYENSTGRKHSFYGKLVVKGTRRFKRSG